MHAPPGLLFAWPSPPPPLGRGHGHDPLCRDPQPPTPTRPPLLPPGAARCLRQAAPGPGRAGATRGACVCGRACACQLHARASSMAQRQGWRLMGQSMAHAHQGLGGLRQGARGATAGACSSGEKEACGVPPRPAARGRPLLLLLAAAESRGARADTLAGPARPSSSSPGGRPALGSRRPSYHHHHHHHTPHPTPHSPVVLVTPRARRRT